MEAVSKLAQVQQLPPPPSQPQAPTPLLLEVQHLRQDIKDLRTALQQAQESQLAIAELKTALGNLTSLVRISAGPRLLEITKALQAELQTARKAQAEEIQRIVHAELKAALQHLKKQIDDLPEKITEVIPQKKGLFG